MVDNNDKLRAHLRRGSGQLHQVYEVDLEMALMTLRHEFLDYAVSQAITLFRDVANRLLDLVNEHAYRMKEQLVDSLAQLLRCKDVW